MLLGEILEVMKMNDAQKKIRLPELFRRLTIMINDSQLKEKFEEMRM